jgi:hypothetical protein
MPRREFKKPIETSTKKENKTNHEQDSEGIRGKLERALERLRNPSRIFIEDCDGCMEED